MAFIDDIQSRDTVLFPFVEIGVQDNNVATTSSIRISTKAVTLFQGSSNPDFNKDWFYSPLLLSSPSIKESIDLENRKYKISNVSLQISNVEYNGERVSDNPELKINARTRIKWMSPSLTRSNDGYTAYIGVIRAITHDDKTCNITLEDISQSSLHRDVPIELLGEAGVPEKYINKPIPMVYGEVDKSPCVIRQSFIEDELNESYLIFGTSEAKVKWLDSPNKNKCVKYAGLLILKLPMAEVTANFDVKVGKFEVKTSGIGTSYTQTFTKTLCCDTTGCSV